MCVCVCARARALRNRIVSMDKILRFANTLIILLLLCNVAGFVAVSR